MRIKPILLAIAILAPLCGNAQTRVDYGTQLRGVPIFTDVTPVTNNLQQFCSGTAGGTLAITRKWTGLATQTIACDVQFTGGSFQPASGQVITITGSITCPYPQQCFDTSVAGAGSVLFTRTSWVPVTWFGGNGNCSAANDVPIAGAIASIATASANSIAGHVYFPQGCYVVTTDIVGTGGIVLQGDNQNSAIIKAAAGSAFVGTYLYDVGTGSVLISNAGFDQIGFDCGTATTCSGISMNRVQEGTVCRDASVVNVTNYGINIYGAGAQNFHCSEWTIGYRAGSTTAVPLSANTSGGTVRLERITVVNPVHGGSQVPACIVVTTGLEIRLDTIHAEGCVKGVDITNGAAGVTVAGFSGDSTTTNGVYIEASANIVTVDDCLALGSTYCLFDASVNNLAIADYVGHYYSINGTYYTDDPTRGVISYSWDGTNQTAIFTPASGQTSGALLVLKNAAGTTIAEFDGDGSFYSAGSFPQVAEPTSAYSARLIDHTILCNASSAPFTVTLPSAVANSRQEYVIMKGETSANAITIASTAGGFIGPGGGATLTLAGGATHSVWLQSNGTNWAILGYY